MTLNCPREKGNSMYRNYHNDFKVRLLTFYFYLSICLENTADENKTRRNVSTEECILR